MPAVAGAWLPLSQVLWLALQLPVVPGTSSGNLRDEAFRSLNHCSTTRQQQACRQADTNLQALIVEQEQPEARERQPRCLGALTQVETALATFRWRLETSTNLQRAIDAAEAQCLSL